MTASYPIANLNEKMNGLVFVLLGNGASEGDLQTMLKTETGQLHAAIGDAIGPKTKEKAVKRMEFDVKKHLTVAPEYTSALFNSGKPMESEGYADFTWLTSGSYWLLGINNEDLQTRASGQDALKMLRAGQRAADRGDAYVRLGKRGKQVIMRLNRIKVSRNAYNYVRQALFNTSGELRAAFYNVAKHYAQRLRIPAWIESKFPQVTAKGKSSFTDTLTPGNPTAFIESTIRAPGVVSNPALSAKINNRLTQRSEIIMAKFKKIMAGHKYNFETGQVFRPQADETFENN